MPRSTFCALLRMVIGSFSLVTQLGGTTSAPLSTTLTNTGNGNVTN